MQIYGKFIWPQFDLLKFLIALPQWLWDKNSPIWTFFLNPLYWLHNISMSSWWLRYVRKTLLWCFQLSNILVKANFNFEPLVGNPTNGMKCTRGKCQLASFKTSAFFWLQLRWNKTSSKNSMAKSSAGWCTNWKGHGVMMKKVMFSEHYSKTWLFHHDPITFSYLYLFSLKALAMLFSEHVFSSL